MSVRVCILNGNSFSRSPASSLLLMCVFFSCSFSVAHSLSFHFSWDLLVNVLISFSAFAIFYSIHGYIYYSYWLTLTLIDVAVVGCGPGCRVAVFFSSPCSLSTSLFLMCCTLLLLLLHCRCCRHCFSSHFLLRFISIFFFLLRIAAHISVHSPSHENREMYILKLLRTRANMEYIDMTFLFSFIRTQQNGKRETEQTIKSGQLRREGEYKCILYQMSILIRTICLLAYFPTNVSSAHQKKER